MQIIKNILYLSILLLTSCSPKLQIHSIKQNSIEVKSEPDSNILSIISPYQIGIDSVMNEILCINNTVMKKGRPESLLGNFVADLCLNQISNQADICVLNMGGLRTVLPIGEITKGKIYELMPFENELVILELEIKSFIELLDHITMKNEPFSGIEIIKSHKGYHINNINDDVETYFKINKKQYIKVLTTDYLANIGEKMSFFQNKEQIKVGIKLRDAIINYCMKQDTIAVKIDNRIKIIENE